MSFDPSRSVVITADNIHHFDKVWEMYRTLPVKELNKITFNDAERAANLFAMSKPKEEGKREEKKTRDISVRITPIKPLVVIPVIPR